MCVVRRLVLVSLAVVAWRVAPQAQNAPASSLVVGAGNFLHVVADVERAIAFYRDTLGLESPAPAVTPRPYLATPEIVRLYDATGGRYRTANAGIAGSPMRAELVEWACVDRAPVAPRYTDPGAVALVLTVRDLDTVLTRVKASGATVVTTGGAPVTVADGAAAARG